MSADTELREAERAYLAALERAGQRSVVIPTTLVENLLRGVVGTVSTWGFPPFQDNLPLAHLALVESAWAIAVASGVVTPEGKTFKVKP